MSRPTLDVVMMANALVWAARSTCSARAAVGAVLASSDGRVIAAGYNGSPSGQPHCDSVGCLLDSDGHCTRSIHAEENAILYCAKHGVSCAGAKMYVTHSPCIKCCKRIIQAGISNVVFLDPYRDADASINELKAANVFTAPLSLVDRRILDELLFTLHSNASGDGGARHS